MAKKARCANAQSPAQRITAEIIKRLEEGTRPWVKPWRGVALARPMRACGIPYQGINVFWLWLVADMCGFASPYWMTYRQAGELGGQVRKGEKATIAVFYKSYTKEVEDPQTGEPGEEARRVLKSYPVFNADQARRYADLLKMKQDLARALRENAPGFLESQKRPMDELLKSFVGEQRQRELWDKYWAYRQAALEPGLSPGQRRLLLRASVATLVAPYVR